MNLFACYIQSYSTGTINSELFYSQFLLDSIKHAIHQEIAKHPSKAESKSSKQEWDFLQSMFAASLANSYSLFSFYHVWQKPDMTDKELAISNVLILPVLYYYMTLKK